MNKAYNIDLDSIKAFIKGNTLVCALALFDIFLFFAVLKQGNTNDALQEKINSIQVKEKQIKSNFGKLSGLEKDFDALKNIKSAISNRCINFGKKTIIYKFLKQITDFLPNDKIDISNTSLYDINKSRNINFNQDLSEFDGDNVVATYNTIFSGEEGDLAKFLEKLNALPYFINLQRLEMRNSSDADSALLNITLSFSLLGKVQLGE